MMTTVTGERLGGRYRLEAVIGSGGIADVWRAHDEVLDRDVAVKLARTPVDATTPEPSRIDGEALALAAVTHPHLVTLFDVGSHEGRTFLVMRLVEGTTLAAVVGEALPAASVATLGAALTDALAHLHAHGIVHRDVKPANVLLDEQGLPLLTDLGIARVIGDDALTATGTTLGTAAYMAPEQVRGADVTSAVDVYALGLVLLECLTGRREYPGPALESAVARLHRAPELPATLPAGWAEVLGAMTALEPAGRPEAAALVERLAALSSGPDVPAAVGAAAVASMPSASPDGLAPTQAAAVVTGGGHVLSETSRAPVAAARPQAVEAGPRTAGIDARRRPGRRALLGAVTGVGAAALVAALAVGLADGPSGGGAPDGAAPSAPASSEGSDAIAETADPADQPAPAAVVPAPVLAEPEPAQPAPAPAVPTGAGTGETDDENDSGTSGNGNSGNGNGKGKDEDKPKD